LGDCLRFFARFKGEDQLQTCAVGMARLRHKLPGHFHGGGVPRAASVLAQGPGSNGWIASSGAEVEGIGEGIRRNLPTLENVADQRLAVDRHGECAAHTRIADRWFWGDEPDVGCGVVWHCPVFSGKAALRICDGFKLSQRYRCRVEFIGLISGKSSRRVIKNSHVNHIDVASNVGLFAPAIPERVLDQGLDKADLERLMLDGARVFLDEGISSAPKERASSAGGVSKASERGPFHRL
jgi:hypothetical protein